jgi:hypothetical protein
MSLVIEDRSRNLEFNRCQARNRSEKMIQTRRPATYRPGLEHELVDEARFFPWNVVVAGIEMRTLRGELGKGLRE